MNILLDTNVIIYFLKGKELAKSFLINLLQNSHIYISAISVAEFIAGATVNEKEKFKNFCSLGEIISVDKKIAEIAGDYRQEFSCKRKKVYLLDCLIAASCKYYNATLVTSNVSDYPMKDIKVVKPK